MPCLSLVNIFGIFLTLDLQIWYAQFIRLKGIISESHARNKRGNVAVALSHMSIWLGMLKHGLDRVVVLEDDVFLNASDGEQMSSVFAIRM